MKHTFYIAKINNHYLYGNTTNLYKITKALLKEHNDCDFQHSYYINFNTGCRVKDARHAQTLEKSFDTFLAPVKTNKGIPESYKSIIMELLNTFVKHSHIKIKQGFKQYFAENVNFSNVEQRMLFNLFHRSTFFQHVYGKAPNNRELSYSRSKYHVKVKGAMLDTYHDYSLFQYILSHKSLKVDVVFREFADYFNITSRSKGSIGKKIVLKSIEKLSTQVVDVNYLCDMEDTKFQLLSYQVKADRVCVKLNPIFEHLNNLRINTHFVEEMYLKDLSLYARTIYPVIYSFHQVENTIDKDLLLQKFSNKPTIQKRFSCVLQGLNELVEKGLIVSGKYDRKDSYIICKPEKVAL